MLHRHVSTEAQSGQTGSNTTPAFSHHLKVGGYWNQSQSIKGRSVGKLQLLIYSSVYPWKQMLADVMGYFVQWEMSSGLFSAEQQQHSS